MYEMKPWMLLGFALYAITTQQKSGLLFASSLTLLMCASYIAHARYVYRKQAKLFKSKW